MNTACHDRVCFSTPACVVGNAGETYAPCETEAEAHAVAQEAVLHGEAVTASVYVATESGVAAHVLTYSLES